MTDESNEAFREKAAGTAKVLAANVAWRAAIMETIPTLSGLEGTFEDFRITLSVLCGEPSHHNAWGAIANVLIRRGLVKPTGEVRHMKTKKSHARKSQVLVIV